MHLKGTMQTLSLVVMIIGSTILACSFIAQTSKTYVSKASYGFSLFSWTQNYIGRILFVYYGALVANSTGIPLLLSQGICSAFTVPVIYYIIRNLKTKGVYVKANFRREIFALRIFMASIAIVSIIIALLMRSEIHVIKVHISSSSLFILSIFCSVIASTSFIPQAIKTFLSKNTKSMSLLLVSLFVIGNFLLVVSFIISLVTTDDVNHFISPIILTTISAVAMMINVMVKIVNVVKKGEKAF